MANQPPKRSRSPSPQGQGYWKGTSSKVIGNCRVVALHFIFVSISEHEDGKIRGNEGGRAVLWNSKRRNFERSNVLIKKIFISRRNHLSESNRNDVLSRQQSTRFTRPIVHHLSNVSSEFEYPTSSQLSRWNITTTTATIQSIATDESRCETDTKRSSVPHQSRSTTISTESTAQTASNESTASHFRQNPSWSTATTTASFTATTTTRTHFRKYCLFDATGNATDTCNVFDATQSTGKRNETGWVVEDFANFVFHFRRIRNLVALVKDIRIAVWIHKFSIIVTETEWTHGVCMKIEQVLVAH